MSAKNNEFYDFFYTIKKIIKKKGGYISITECEEFSSWCRKNLVDGYLVFAIPIAKYGYKRRHYVFGENVFCLPRCIVSVLTRRTYKDYAGHDTNYEHIGFGIHKNKITQKYVLCNGIEDIFFDTYNEAFLFYDKDKREKLSKMIELYKSSLSKEVIEMLKDFDFRFVESVTPYKVSIKSERRRTEFNDNEYKQDIAKKYYGKYQADTPHEFEVIKQINGNNIIIEFTNPKCIINITIYSLRCSIAGKSTINNPMIPSVEGVGYLGIGNHKSGNSVYARWSSTLSTSVNQFSYYNYHNLKNGVCEKWKNYQNFAEWHENNNKCGKYIFTIFNTHNDYFRYSSPKTTVFVDERIVKILSMPPKNSSTGYGRISFFRGKLCVAVGGKKYYLKKHQTIEDAYELWKIKSKEYLMELVNEDKDLPEFFVEWCKNFEFKQ